jgi:hypothetical protein
MIIFALKFRKMKNLYINNDFTEELGQDAYLLLAPNHIYIKTQNKRVGWYNIELTCSDFPKTETMAALYKQTQDSEENKQTKSV